MRIALLTALAFTAATTWADEPTASEAKADPAKLEAPAAEQTAANDTTTASIATEDEKPFKPPAGYRLKRVKGTEVYCTKVVVLGSRFPKEDCRTEAQLRDLERQKEAMRAEMDQLNHICSGNGACGGN